LPIDGIELAMVRHTKLWRHPHHQVPKYLSRDAQVRWQRCLDGPVQSAKASELANDSLLIVFEPERRIFTVDLETG
jgi:hypothetical protein